MTYTSHANDLISHRCVDVCTHSACNKSYFMQQNHNEKHERFDLHETWLTIPFSITAYQMQWTTNQCVECLWWAYIAHVRSMSHICVLYMPFEWVKVKKKITVQCTPIFLTEKSHFVSVLWQFILAINRKNHLCVKSALCIRCANGLCICTVVCCVGRWIFVRKNLFVCFSLEISWKGQ